MQDGPLDMRMSSTGISAKEIIDTYSIEDLSKIFFLYGEEKMSRVIAKKIVSEKKNINSTLELVEVIKSSVGANYFYKHHPERKIFQALRIEVNNELEVFKVALEAALSLIQTGGRVCVITFHSLEDRICKQIFKEYSVIDSKVKGLPIIPEEFKPKLKLIGKAIKPSKKELEENNRSRSAKLRIAQKL